MNSKIIINLSDFDLYPYNYRMIEYIVVEKNTTQEAEENTTQEVEEKKIKNLKIHFYKTISRVQ